MKPSKLGAGLIVLFCGGKLIVAIAIGGAGLSALLGVEGVLVGAVILMLLGGFFMQRQRRLAS